jgi:predicted Zn-dependent protease
MTGRFSSTGAGAQAQWLSMGVVCIGLVAGLAASGCGGPQEQGGEGPGRRQQVLGLSPGQEIELGRQAARQVRSDPRKFGRVVPRDRPECQRVREVMGRLVEATRIQPLMDEMNLKRRGYQYEWEADVLDKEDVNAFCLPGGKMFVFRGLLALVQNDDQLATVLSHEMAHALAHHASERVANDEMNHSPLGGIWTKSFQRDQEAEADHIGLFLMTFAGYDPEEAVTFWRRMQRASGGRQQIPEILSDHPSDAHRIEKMQEWVPRAKAALRAYRQGNIAPSSRR